MTNQYPYQQQYPQQPYPQQGWQPVSPAAQPANPFADQAPNPYAAPLVTTPYQQQPKMSPFAGLWRQGNLLVMHKLAPLPDICLKSNEPATRRLKRNLSWHHPAVYLAILAHLLIYILVALIVRKTATIQVPLTDEWYARRQRRMITAWLLVLLGAVVFASAIPLLDQFDAAPLLFLVGIVILLGAAIFGLLACRLVWPDRITDEYIWLKGVHPEFLNRLEIWPYHL